jgi:hypothetical protein
MLVAMTVCLRGVSQVNSRKVVEHELRSAGWAWDRVHVKRLKAYKRGMAFGMYRLTRMMQVI